MTAGETSMKTLKTVAAAILMVSFFSALSASVPEAKKEFGSAVTTMPPLTTKRAYLPRRQSGYAFVSNIEQIAYISAEQSSMIHFMPVNPSHKPKLFIALPPEVRLQGAFRDLAVEKAGTFSHDGKELDRYRINAGPRASKYTFLASCQIPPRRYGAARVLLGRVVQGKTGAPAAENQGGLHPGCKTVPADPGLPLHAE